MDAMTERCENVVLWFESVVTIAANEYDMRGSNPYEVRIFEAQHSNS